MTLYKKDFAEIAEILIVEKDNIDPHIYNRLVWKFRLYLETKSEIFDYKKFETACGVEGN